MYILIVKSGVRVEDTRERCEKAQQVTTLGDDEYQRTLALKMHIMQRSRRTVLIKSGFTALNECPLRLSTRLSPYQSEYAIIPVRLFVDTDVRAVAKPY